MASYTTGIELAFIPQIILDAINVVHTVGMRYLWVDAFCIIQDSSQDKKFQLREIRRIFRNAHFTLIASSATSTFAGLLHPRALPDQPRTQSPYWTSSGRICVVTVREDHDATDDSLEAATTRAWCLEECLLSLCKIIFAAATLQFLCQSTTASVCRKYMPVAENLPSVMFAPDAVLAAHVSKWGFVDWYGCWEEWANTVGRHTPRDVTNADNRLAALADVVEQWSTQAAL